MRPTPEVLLAFVRSFGDIAQTRLIAKCSTDRDYRLSCHDDRTSRGN